jgi:hypothetical protein
MRRFLDEVHELPKRSVAVEIPDVDLTTLEWPEAALLAHFAFNTPNPVVDEWSPPNPEENQGR